MRHSPNLLLLICALAFAACGGGGGGGDGGGGTNPNIPALSILGFSGVTLSPAFSPEVLVYAASVASTVDAVTVTAGSNASGATITLDGTQLSGSEVLSLAEGDNDFTIAVTVPLTDQNPGQNVRTYTVTVTRAPTPTLSGLAISAGTLVPDFDPETTSYTTSVGFLATRLQLTPTTALAGATITVNGLPTASGQTGEFVQLAQGINNVVVRLATSQGETREYSIAVNRQAVSQFLQQTTVGPTLNGSFGGSIAISGDTMAVGDQTSPGAFGPGAVYMFTRGPGTSWVQQGFLKASNEGMDDKFGFSVALDGDTLVVGAPQEDSSTQGVNGLANESAANSGAAYVFTWNGSAWTQQAFIKASNTGADDGFGISVDVHDDTLVVGAINEDTGGSNSGAAYVFTRSNGTWSQQALLKASNVQSDDIFGVRVAVDDDTVVVGASREDSSTTGVNSTPNNSAPDSGAAYVFVRSGSTWTQEAYLKAFNPSSDDLFGSALAISGTTIAIGAYREDTGGSEAGAVYVFQRASGAWVQEAFLQASNADAFDRFGLSLALDGDVLAVGALGEDSFSGGINSPNNNNASNSGAAYIFTRAGNAWGQQAFVKSNAGSLQSQELGSSIALDGEFCASRARSLSSPDSVILFR